MKKIPHYVGLFAWAVFAPLASAQAAPSDPPLSAKAYLNDVRLYVDGAVLNHGFTAVLPAGPSTVEVSGLSQQVDESSIQLRTRSSVKVQGYRIEVREKNLLAVPELKIWRDSLTTWRTVEEQARSQQAVIQLEKDAFLRSTQQTTYTEANQKFWALSAAEWVKRTHAAQKSLEQAQRGTQRVSQKYQEIVGTMATQESVLVLELNAAAPVATALFALEYATPLAHWSPRYEVRMDNASVPQVDLISKASILQHTGLDWKKVTLTLGSNRPRGGLATPVLQPWWVSPNGSLARRKMDIVENDLEIAYGGRAPAAVAKYEAPMANFDDAERSEGLVGYSLVLPGTHQLAHLEEREISLETRPLKAELSRYAAPRLDLRVFLVARIPGWDTLVNVDGPATIYLENNLVGNSFLMFQSDTDTLDLALGADPRTSVEWKPTVATDNKGGKVERTYSYTLKVSTLHANPVEVVVEDRSPMPRAEEIALLNPNFGGAKKNADTGILTWKASVAKEKPWFTSYRYTLRYPRTMNAGPL